MLFTKKEMLADIKKKYGKNSKMVKHFIKITSTHNTKETEKIYFEILKSYELDRNKNLW